jgi:hypothetical protein
MKKATHFLEDYEEGEWPDPASLAPYFLTASGRHKAFGLTNDCWGLSLEGIEGTEHLGPVDGRIDIRLIIIGHPDLGVLLCYQRLGGKGAAFYSEGNLNRLHEWIRTIHGDLMPIGLFIPFETAWKAIKEFIESNAALPKSIPWVANRDLPVDAFPDPLQGARIRD